MKHHAQTASDSPHAQPTTPSLLSRALRRIRQRILAGLLLILPFVVTVWIVVWLYTTLDYYLISPAARFVVYVFQRRAGEIELPPWFGNFFAPVFGLLVIGLMLYFLGFVAKARLGSLIDSLLLRVPIITTIHKSVRGVFASMQSAQADVSRFKRSVLVSFPHPGMRVPAFVTNSCIDQATGKKILCVYVPTTPIPTSGYMLMIPEEDVTDLNWDLEETIQAVVSFGLTSPTAVTYYWNATPAADPQPPLTVDGKVERE